MKSAIFTFLAANLLLTSAYAAEICGDNNKHWDKTRCATTAGSVAAATGSGIFSAKKYKEAKSIEAENVKRVFENSKVTNSGEDARAVTRSTQQFTNGDRITIQYNLSEAENRQYHIDLKEDQAASARSMAAHHAIQAVTATHTVTESVYSGTDQNGNAQYTTTTRTEPDANARAWHALQAIEETQNAAKYAAEATAARHGGPVPIHTLEKEIKVKAGTAEATNLFAQERIERGGKILSIDRLPVEHFNRIKNVVMKARAGVVGVVVGAGLAVEEATAGLIADHYRENRSAPKMKSYGGIQE